MSSDCLMRVCGIPCRGVCDPQIRVWDGETWLQRHARRRSRHHGLRKARLQVWGSRGRHDRCHAGTLRPEQTYWGKPSDECWATDAARKDGRYYLCFSVSHATPERMIVNPDGSCSS